ncbi:MAG: FAD-dependent oxidoreductase [Anaerolineales bacterium]|nr:FAD-dependent oxidoreductase [Anaerolineales bacterium]
MSGLTTEVLVIGGGATGLGVALDACVRGMQVVLVERGDLGQGTSGRYHGLLHSGGRYVITDPASARDCALENTVLRRIAPSTIEDTGGLFLSAAPDPPEFADRWLNACAATGVPAEELSLEYVFRLEPALARDLQRAFRVSDASLDSFDLLHLLADTVRSAGGQILTRHPVEKVLVEGGRVVGAALRPGPDGVDQVRAEAVVNAAGPWAGRIAASAGAEIPIALGKGAMLALAARPVHTILNRCKMPSDGDIVVPVGTVAVLGTTDKPVASPDDISIAPWEIDLLLAEARFLLPDVYQMRPLRAWSGIRPLYRPPSPADDPTRLLPRAHTIIDHGRLGQADGLISIFGGKLTTYRKMAEEAVDLLSARLGNRAGCTTATTPLEPLDTRRLHALPRRLQQAEDPESSSFSTGIVCECELVTQQTLDDAIRKAEAPALDDLRRDTRLGMGPCQAAFCAYRAAGRMVALRSDALADGGLGAFLQERWRGVRPLAWGHTLRQLELDRRIALELLGVETQEATPDG